MCRTHYIDGPITDEDLAYSMSECGTFEKVSSWKCRPDSMTIDEAVCSTFDLRNMYLNMRYK
jgi:hypothetical protein